MPSNNVKYITVGPITTGSASAIAIAQTPSGAGDLTLNGSLVSGGVATLDVTRRILFTFAADESAKTVTIYGADRIGRSVSETLTPPSGGSPSGAYSVLDYKTVTEIAVSAAFSGSVTVGTGTKISSQWFPLSLRTEPLNANLALEFSTGAVATVDVEYTADDIQDLSVTNPVVFTDSTLVGKTSNASKNLTEAWRACRMTLLLSSGSVKLAILQPRHR